MEDSIIDERWYDDIKEVEVHCVVCQRTFKYREGNYRPKTCNNYDCLHSFLHDPRYRGLRENTR